MAVGTRTLRTGELLTILGEIYRDRDTGTLVLQRGEVSRFLYLQEGLVIFAASNAPEDKFTQILVDEGKLTQEQLALATEKKENRTIGRTLVDMGFLGSEDLLEALVAQLRKIAFSAVNWDDGTAAFKPGVLPQNVARLPVSTPRFLVDLALAIQDRELVASSLGQLDAPVLLSPAEREAARSLPPSAQESRILEQVDGKRSAREVCERAGADLFTGSRFLLGLSHLGLLRVRQIIAPGRPEQAASVPDELAFLEEKAPAGPEADSGPVAEPEPPSRGLPFETASPATPAQEAPPTPVAPPRPKAPAPILPELLPTPSAATGTGGRTPPEPPSFLSESPPSRSRWALVAMVGLILVAAGAGSVWYFFLRPSGVIPVEPRPAVHRRPAPAARPATETGAAASPAPAGQADAAPVVPPPAQPAPQAAVPPASAGAPRPEPGPQGPEAPSTKPVPAPAQAAQAAPAASPAGDPRGLLDSGRYPEAAHAFRKAFENRRGGYIVNIEVACQDETVAKGLAAAAGAKEYALLPYSLKGRPCYLVVWGYYPDRPEAEAALKGLPAFFLQAAQPRIVPWSKVVELTGPAP